MRRIGVLSVCLLIICAVSLAWSQAVPTSQAAIHGHGTPGAVPLFTSATTVRDSVIFQDSEGRIGINNSVPTSWGQQNNKPVYYDTFGGKWLDPAKWLVGWGPDCGASLECVREIQSGQLRLAVRGLGDTNSDSGGQSGSSVLYFINPNAINSMTADVTQRSFNGTGCSTNSTDRTFTAVGITGFFFNTGSGDHADDVLDEVVILVDTNHPKTMSVSNWMTVSGLGTGTSIADYPLGTPLTVTLAWDQPNHQFVSVVKITGDSGTGRRVVVPYYVSDTTPPAFALRSFNVNAYPLNCTSARTFAQVEAFYDNVMINAMPPYQNQQ